MQNFSGMIFSGDLDRMQESFYLTQVKNLETASILSEKKLTELNHYLSSQDDTCMITINDQIPILLKEQEVSELVTDLTKIIDALKAP
ncbi:hypothetical protein [Oceanobacillus damuensis]|uniref:hypothetical protein n=1 Tax=Oceanobacillus damuensis TaxID=937928 RepID=UPI0008329DAE|nr:hypothetical protein [Oceanobacillus damuensis]